MWCWERTEKTIQPEKQAIEESLKRAGGMRTPLKKFCIENKLTYAKKKLIAIEEQIMQVKEVKRKTQLLNSLRNRRKYWELKEEGEDRKKCKLEFIS